MFLWRKSLDGCLLRFFWFFCCNWRFAFRLKPKMAAWLSRHSQHVSQAICEHMRSVIITVMKASVLRTNNPDLKLIEPDIERDAVNGVKWLEGDMGRATLLLMGVADEHNKPTTLKAEEERVNDFLTRQDQLNWMIEYQGEVVGSVWVDLEASDFLASPSVHVMIGDPNMRGKGVGLASVSSVLEYLKSGGEKTVYSRYVTSNEGSEHLLAKLGFEVSGEPYNDGYLLFQNVKLNLGATPEGEY